ncbi:MAG: hypothetical protein ACOYL6_17805 [Bacteriovoracaceae bacterium]
MKVVIVLLYVLIATSSAYAIESEQMNFKYMNYEGDMILHCKHFAIDEYKFDWDLTCKNETGSFFKKFRAHVALSKYGHPTPPLSTYEVLYWVTDLTNNQTYGTGTSLWFNFNNDADFHSLTISQSVDNDTAGLYLDIKP